MSVPPDTPCAYALSARLGAVHHPNWFGNGSGVWDRHSDNSSGRLTHANSPLAEGRGLQKLPLTCTTACLVGGQSSSLGDDRDDGLRTILRTLIQGEALSVGWREPHLNSSNLWLERGLIRCCGLLE